MPSLEICIGSPPGCAALAGRQPIALLSDVTSRKAHLVQRRPRSETFLRHMRYVGMKQGDIWYVTFGPDKADKTAESMVRSTRTFKSEVDAKLFAMQILSKGWTASAGTLNPHQPKQVVGPAQIESWADPGLGG